MSTLSFKNGEDFILILRHLCLHSISSSYSSQTFQASDMNYNNYSSKPLAGVKYGSSLQPKRACMTRMHTTLCTHTQDCRRPVQDLHALTLLFISWTLTLPPLPSLYNKDWALYE